MSQLLSAETISEPKFDWQRIVRSSLPGEASPEQRSRLAALQRLTTDLYAWARAFQLPEHRVESSSYTGVVVTDTPTPYKIAWPMSIYTLWLFVFDGYVDRLSYDSLPDQSPQAKQAYLDERLAPITAPLYSLGGLSDAEGQAYGLPPRMLEIPAEPSDRSDDRWLAYRIGEAFIDLYRKLEALWNSESHNATDYCLRIFVHETAAVLGGMRGELLQSFAFQADGTQPSLEEYLNHSYITICLRAAASIAIGFEQDPEQVWQPWADAMYPSKKALRICNDLANIDKEIEEGKVNSVTVCMRDRGIPSMQGYTSQSPELLEVKALLRERRDKELKSFAKLMQGLPEGPLAYYVRNCSAFTIAMYEHGDYTKPV